MALFRSLLAWMLLAALPLQGFAAASMLYCGPVGSAQHRPAAMADAAQDHHADAVEKHEHASIGNPAEATDAPSTSSALPDLTHKCGVCASCCHGVGIAETPFLLSVAPAPQRPWQQPFVAVHSRPAPVPDKPPRA